MDPVLYLEVDEEITSVIDKLKRSKSSVIAIVAPRNAILLQSIVNLKLLKKEADRFGKDVSLVTADPVGQNLALRTGLTVYANIHDKIPIAGAASPRPNEMVDAADTPTLTDSSTGIHVRHYREPVASVEPVEPAFTSQSLDNNLPDDGLAAESSPGDESSSPPQENFSTHHVESVDDEPEESDSASKLSQIRAKPAGPSFRSTWWHRRRIVIALVGLAVLIGAGLLTLLFLPRATVTVSVPTETYTQAIAASVQKDLTSPDATNNILPGRLLESTQQSTTQAKATGTKNVGKKATGSINVINETGIDQSFDAGTTFHSSSSNLAFTSDKAFTVPKATLNQNGDKVNGSVAVTVTAAEAGEKYNLAATSYSIAGYSKVSGQGGATTGGSTQVLTIVSQDDITAATAAATQTLYKQAADDLGKNAGKAVVLSKAIKNDVVSATPNAKIGDQVSDFQIDVKTKSSTIIFDRQPLTDLVNSNLKAKIPGDKTILSDDSTKYDIAVNSFDLAAGTIKMQVSATARISPKIDQAALKSALVGKSETEAETYLKAQPGISDAKVQLIPGWWLKRIPNLTNRINLNVNYLDPTAATPSPSPTSTP